MDRSATPEQLAALMRLMKGFQLNALKITLLFGPKYLAFLDCDGLTGKEIVAKARQFERAAAGITLLVGKAQMRALGVIPLRSCSISVTQPVCAVFVCSGSGAPGLPV